MHHPTVHGGHGFLYLHYLHSIYCIEILKYATHAGKHLSVTLDCKMQLKKTVDRGTE